MTLRISRLLRSIIACEVVILLIAGGGMFFAPDILGEHWAWMTLPYNTRFIGAIYIASMTSALALVIYPYWSLGRVVVPMITIFTLIVLVISLLYLPHFNGPIYAVILWFVLYVMIPAISLLHLWLYRNQRMPAQKLSRDLRLWLNAESIMLGTYGIALLIIPQFASKIFPWELNPFHARIYSVAFITPALGAYLLSRSASQAGTLVLGITKMMGGTLPIIGVLIVDQSIQRIAWSTVNTWVWIGLFAYILVSGILLIIASINTSNFPRSIAIMPA